LIACNDDNSSDQVADPNAVSTTEGMVVGETVSGANSEDMRTWLGVPYAQSTAGPNRFEAPQPLPARSEALLATELGDACPQTPDQSPFAIQSSNPGIDTSEDCLNLNIYSPAEGKNHPVIVWLHGGGLDTGAGAQSGGNPDRLVEQGIVVVTVNYRLGLLGYLAHPALTARSTTSQPGSGNFGLMDQIKALEWLQDNVANFGGDSSNVTVMGESAGGFSIKGLMAADDRTDGLFHRAIIQSGPSLTQETLAEAETRGATFMSGLCANDASDEAAACLRNLSVAELLSAQAGTPAFDASIIQRPGVLERTVAVSLASGQFTGDQVLEGSNRDEWRLFVAAEQLVSQRQSLESLIADDADAYRAELIKRYAFVNESNADVIVDLYPLSDFENADIAVSAVGTDPIFACPGLANISAAAQHVPVYAYEFADRNAPLPSPLFAAVQPALGAAHATEIPYILASAESVANDFSADSATLADAMLRHWASFARNGDPNPSDGTLSMWSSFTDQGYQSLQAPATNSGTFSSVNAEGSTFAEDHKCSLWSPG
jgi:para-nitrobenzyl esterase